MPTLPCAAGRRSPANRQHCSQTDVRSMRSQVNPLELQKADMRGRRPKPTRLKVLTGNPGKRPMNKHEPKPEPAVPGCLNELGPVARREWDRLASELCKLKILTALDRAALAAYCGAYALWAEATEAIQKFGTMVKSSSGYPIQSLTSRSPIVRPKSRCGLRRNSALRRPAEAEFQRQSKTSRICLISWAAQKQNQRLNRPRQCA